jgi:hypothetical protein
MKKNMGPADRIIRSLIAVVILALVIAKVLYGALGIILGIVAVVFLVTAAVARCPGYVPLKVSTVKGQGPGAGGKTA